MARPALRYLSVAYILTIGLLFVLAKTLVIYLQSCVILGICLSILVMAIRIVYGFKSSPNPGRD